MVSVLVNMAKPQRAVPTLRGLAYSCKKNLQVLVCMKFVNIVLSLYRAFTVCANFFSFRLFLRFFKTSLDYTYLEADGVDGPGLLCAPPTI